MTAPRDDIHGARLAGLRGWIAAQGLDGLLIPHADPHQSEAPPPRDACLRWLTGFSGSAGMALVLPERAVIFVDGRYQVQVRGEIDPGAWEIGHLHDAPPEDWLAAHAPMGARIGVDAMRVNLAQFRRLEAGCRKAGAALVALEGDPFDALWADRPAPPLGPVRAVPTDIAGESSAEKRARIAAMLEGGFLIETQPDNIAWLLNLRGSDVPMNPVPLSFLILAPDGAAEWFVDARKLGNSPPEGATIHDPADFPSRVAERAAGQAALLDPDFTPAALAQAVTTAGGRLVEQTDPITLAKARKTPAELLGFRDCCLEDGAAMVDFFAWLTREIAAGAPVTELSAEARLLAFRADRPGYLEPSFRTISAAGANAAMCHYAASPQSDAPIARDAPYLLDSGGQYLTGTTDITRTAIFGPATGEMRAAYTAVLQGFIALHDARFPVGTMGHQLEALARAPLWRLGLDYDHGTGHGVGHNLLVHEHPHRFARKANPFGLEPGIVMTIEPGFYKPGAFGMRIENQVEVVADGPGFCRFRALTLAPIDLTMVERAALSPAEAAWIDAYHARVRAALIDKVAPEARDWLIEATRPLAAQ